VFREEVGNMHAAVIVLVLMNMDYEYEMKNCEKPVSVVAKRSSGTNSDQNWQ